MLIFNRYENFIELFISQDENTFEKSTAGYTAIALYLYAIGGNIPTEPYAACRQNSRNNFQPEKHRLQTGEGEGVYFISKKQPYTNSPSWVVSSRVFLYTRQERKVDPPYVLSILLNSVKIFSLLLICTHLFSK